MKDELQLKLVEILTSIQNTAGKAGDFAMSQLPEIAQTYVVYGRAMGLLSTIGMALVAAASVWATVRMARASGDGLELMPLLGSMFSGVFAVFASLIAFASVPNAILVWTAPKVWLLKELAGLIK